MTEPKPKPATRHFFRKAVAPPPKPPCDPHARKYHPRQTAVSEMADPLTGARVMRKTNASWAYRKIAASKAGKASQASGNANRFTSESGRKASLKLWKTRQRMVNGIRIGVKLARKPKLDRKAIRAIYNETPKHGIECVIQQWFGGVPSFYWQRTDADTGVVTRITERTALIRLGYMKQYLRFVPESVRLLPLPGTKGAVGTDNSTTNVSGESK